MEQKQDSGVLFRNKKKEMPNHPDYTGKLNASGTDYYVSAWINEPRGGGEKYLAFKINKVEDSGKPAAVTATDEFLL